MKRILSSFFIILILSVNVFAQTKTISDKTEGMKKYTGYFNYYWDNNTGNIWLEIDKIDEEFLYVSSLPAGLGSNDIGLDRGQLGGTKVVKFERIGPKILMVQQNYNYRALSDNPNERKAVDQAFAKSTIWGFKVEAEENGSVLVNATSFYLRDAHGVIGRLRGRREGTYKLVESKSALYLPMMKNFPENTEVEATLTFDGTSTGRFVRSVTPDASSITIREHHSFIKLPDSNYKPRKYDTRGGYGGISYLDYATPISEPIRKSFIRRHRLVKKNPNASRSEAVEPIIYYVDNGAPEPIRSALVEGASWWNQAYEAAGFINAFQVKVLPDDADPMDVRYNTINWVHRSTRGWSYGSSVTDPRTGEIIKGHVSLGSLRVRQDFLIASGLLAPYEDGTTVPKEMEEMALARLRQLSAHEVGHTIGLSHNFASSVNNRASVMDYPHPLMKISNSGQIDLSDAYDVGIGDWDKAAITFGYQQFPNGKNDDVESNKFLESVHSQGLLFLTDQDARSTGSANPLAHLWDNSGDPVTELEHVLKVRKIALDNFSEKNIRKSMPMATLEEVLVPIYLLHRYQVDAASKVLGGMTYYYKLRGDNQPMHEIVSADKQRKSLNALLKTLSADELTLSEKIIRLIPPRPPGYGQTPELFRGRTGSTFDPLTAAESAASQTMNFLMNADRAARLVEFHSRDNKLPGLEEVIDKTIQTTWNKNIVSGLRGEVQMVVNNVFLTSLIRLAANRNTSYQARAIALYKVKEIKHLLKSKMEAMKPIAVSAHYNLGINDIEQFIKDPNNVRYSTPLAIPNGSPIGMGGDLYCDFKFDNN